MKCLYIRTCTTIEDACQQVVDEAKKCNERVVADFNDFIIDSSKGVEKNLKDYWCYWRNWKDGVNWEQRRYNLVKDIFLQSINNSDSRFFAVMNKDSLVKEAIEFADALIKELQK